MTSYPAIKQTFSDPAGTTLLTTVDHANLHVLHNDTVEAIQDVIGTTQGVGVLINFDPGDYAARITAGNVLKQRVSGTLDNGILGTPAINHGTITLAILGTNTLIGGTLSGQVVNNGTLAGGSYGTVNLIGGTSTNQVVNTATLGTPTVTLGSDSAGDIYYRSAGGTVTRLAAGTPGQNLQIDAGTVPSWRIGNVIRHQFGTVNTTQSNVSEELGVYWITGDGVASLYIKDVTFPTAFGTILGVAVSGLGYKDASDPSAVTDFLEGGSSLQTHEPQVSPITTTGFRVVHLIDAGVALTSGRRVGFFWRAYGIKTT